MDLKAISRTEQTDMDYVKFQIMPSNDNKIVLIRENKDVIAIDC